MLFSLLRSAATNFVRLLASDREGEVVGAARAILRVLKTAGADNEDGFRSVDGIPWWHAMAVFCQDHSARLRGNETNFIDDIVGWSTWREPTPKQAKWLQSVYARLGGRLPP